jgi:hypothetical protein
MKVVVMKAVAEKPPFVIFVSFVLREELSPE